MNVSKTLLAKFTAGNLLLVAAVACGLTFATTANARYSAIDADPDGNAIQLDFDGYCDTQFIAGDQCDEFVTLPYAVNFGGGFTDKIQFRSDGTFDFIGDPNGNSFPDINQFDKLATITSGLFPDPSLPFDPSEIQLVEYAVTPDEINANWFYCATPQNCYLSNGGVTLTRRSGGYDIQFRDLFIQNGSLISERTKLAGWSTPNSSDLSETRTTFFLPATFSPAIAVPEPATWAMMIFGFGAVGSMIRRRKAVVA